MKGAREKFAGIYSPGEAAIKKPRISGVFCVMFLFFAVLVEVSFKGHGGKAQRQAADDNQRKQVGGDVCGRHVFQKQAAADVDEESDRVQAGQVLQKRRHILNRRDKA